MIDGVLVIYSNPEEGGTGDSGEGYMVNGRGGRLISGGAYYQTKRSVSNQAT